MNDMPMNNSHEKENHFMTGLSDIIYNRFMNIKEKI